MEEQKHVQESLRVLLAELQKVKDLNNLANQYKLMVANLLTAIQDYLNNNKDFSESFTSQLQQTYQSLKDTKITLEQTHQSLNETQTTLEQTLAKATDDIEKQLSEVRSQNEELHTHVNKELAYFATLLTQVQSTMESNQTTQNLKIDQLTSQGRDITERLTTVEKTTETTLTEKSKELVESVDEAKLQTSKDLALLSKRIQGTQQTLEQQGQQTAEAIQRCEKTLNETNKEYLAQNERNFQKLKSGQTHTRLMLLLFFLTTLLYLFLRHEGIL
jgi:hypothetical protein